MSRNSSSQQLEVPELLNKLCERLGGSRREELYRFAIQYLSCEGQGNMGSWEDTNLFGRISKRIKAIRSEEDAVMFKGLYEKLLSCGIVKCVQPMLTLLVALSESSDHHMPFINFDARNKGSSLRLRPKTSVSSYGVEKLYQAPTRPQTSSSCTSENLNMALQPLRMSVSNHSIGSQLSEGQKKRLPSIYADDVPESMLVQEVVYCFQGVEGQVLRRDAGGGYYLNPRANVRPPTARLVLRLAELGYLHDKVKQYIDPLSGKAPLGLMGQGLISELRSELTEYYRMVAVLHEQIKLQTDAEMSSQMLMLGSNSVAQVTLFKLVCWVIGPIHRLKWLCTIAKACEGKKGGALASTIYSFLGQGDPRVCSLVSQLLGAACGPLYTMMVGWLLDGEVKDPSGEFFIEALPNICGDRLWHEKYRVRTNMLPDFLSLDQANRILATGKCINFLREVCQDSQPLQGRDALRRVLESSSVEALFCQSRDSSLHSVMDSAYRDASRRVLDTLKGKHKLLNHLQALRRYMLVGQGDFIRHLMELIDPELVKPGVQLFRHNLSSILESAIRSTNAQYDDPDILNRLDVKLIEASSGDTGWDIFSLQYHVKGPIGTVFEPVEDQYSILFNNLWRAKRMEFILSRLWREQMTSSKMLQKMNNLRPITQQLHLLTSEMVHFVHQMQYYILFEVLECSWLALIERVHRAESLDDILKAHSEFLKTVETGSLLTSGSEEQKLFPKLFLVYNPIVELQVLQQSIYSRALVEQNTRIEFREHITKSEAIGKYGMTAELKLKRDSERKDFDHFIEVKKVKLNIIAGEYEKYCKNFLLLLSLTNNVSLQLLSNRLDFNGYYKKSDLRLNAPLTYQHKRMSQMQAFNQGLINRHK